MGTLYTAGNRLTASLLNQYYGFADTTATTVTAAVQTTLTTVYTIPANEPVAGSAYEMLFGGSGTWGSTQQNLAFQLSLSGVGIVNNVVIDHTVFSTSAGFRFEGRGIWICNANGSSGSFYGGLWLTLTQVANNVIPGTAANNTVGIADANATTTTTDTTSNMFCKVTAGWAGTTGTPTITNRHTIFRKVA